MNLISNPVDLIVFFSTVYLLRNSWVRFKRKKKYHITNALLIYYTYV